MAYECEDKMVSHPKHYQTSGGLETIEVIEAFTEGLDGIEAVCTGNAIKYLCRWKKKNGVQDLEKAAWYVTHLIGVLKGRPATVSYADLVKGSINDLHEKEEESNE